MDLKTIVAWAKRKGFVFPGSEIYGGLANAWDFGPYGILLKKNISDKWWEFFVKQRTDIVGLDAAILMNTRVWKTSGHLDNFNDPMIDDKNTGERFRADKLIEEKIKELNSDFSFDYFNSLCQQFEISVSKDLMDDIRNFEILLGKIRKNLGKYCDEGNFDEALQKIKNFDFKNSGYFAQKIKNLKIEDFDCDEKYNELMHYILLAVISGIIEENLNSLNPETRTLEQMEKFIKTFIPNNPNNGKKADWTAVRKFNLMFKTFQGVLEDDANTIYLRPETAQGIFVNFKNILDTMRIRLPFGIAQIGKAFRNEITPGNFLYRVREFEQMEIEYFVNPEQDEEFFEKWKNRSREWRTEKIGIKLENLRFRDHEKEELAHYSKGTTDVEYKFPRGRGELQGIANRTDFDLRQHMKESGVDMQYSDPITGKRFVPYVIEPSWGLTRAVLAVMLDAYNEENYVDANGKEASRVVLKFNFEIAPVKYAILPLIKKDEKQVKIAREIFEKLSKKYYCEYDEQGAIGKRYRRQDEIGTPFCITVDYQTLEDGTVTLRDRDSMEQRRVKIEELV